MPKYNYIAKDDEGKTVRDAIEAKSRYDALTALKERYTTVISLYSTEKEPSVSVTVSPLEKKKETIFRLPFRMKEVGLNELAVFSRQLSVSVSAGIPLIDALDSIAEDIENIHFRKVLKAIVSDVRSGMHFSDAMAKHKRVFNPLFIAMMRSAEESGSIVQSLEYMSSLLEKSEKLTRRIASITTYPIFVCGFFIVILFIVTIFILPRFQEIFSNFGAELPFFTQIVFRVNEFLVSNVLLLFLIVVGVIAGIFAYSCSKEGRYKIDGIILKLPLMGELIRKASIAKFCRILSAMIRGGVSVVRAIEISAGITGNKVLEKSLMTARQRIIDGSDISSSLGKEKHFPRLVVRMVKVGESSGQLPDTLDKVSEMYEDQVEGSIMVMTSLFEPVMIVVFGGLILILVISIYIPVFKVALSMRGV